jgi:hypothetical protein
MEECKLGRRLSFKVREGQNAKTTPDGSAVVDAIFTSSPTTRPIKSEHICQRNMECLECNTSESIGEGNWPLGLHTSVPTTFLIYTDGKTFVGKAIVDTYPGYGDLKDGIIDGNNISFTVIAYALVNFKLVDETIYYTGTVNGDEMDLVMRWPLNAGPDRHPVLQLNMKAKKFRHG